MEPTIHEEGRVPDDTTDDQNRLDQLGEQIERVRRDAEEDGLLPDSTPEPTFVDPDADGDADGTPAGTP
jgi:hypothetical protein